MIETWHPVAGFAAYEVSDRGRVRGQRGVLKPMPIGVGRCMMVDLCIPAPHRRYRRSIAHLVLGAFVGPRPHGMVCRHLNDVQSDNRLSNLVWGTHQENEADRKLNGRVPRGETHGSALLTARQVRYIRQEAAAQRVGRTKRVRPGFRIKMSRKFGVSIGTIGDVVQERSWA